MKKISKWILAFFIWLTGNTWWDRFGIEFKKGIILDILLMDAFLGALFIYNLPTIEKYYSLSISFCSALFKAITVLLAFLFLIKYYNWNKDKMKPEQRMALSVVIILSYIGLLLHSKKKIPVQQSFV